MTRLLLFLRQNSVLVVLALVFSWMVWVQVSTVFVETKRLEIPVRILPEDEKAILLLGHEPEVVTVEVSGNRRLIDRLDPSTTSAVFRIRREFLDESGEVQSRTFTAEDLELPADLDLLLMSPSEVRASFAVRETRDAAVEVLVDRSGAPEGLRLVEAIPVPPRIEIEGPLELVQRTDAIHTLRIALRDHVPTGAETTVRGVFPLDLAALRREGLRTRSRDVTVLFRFEHGHTRDEVWIPLEVHWVDPTPEDRRLVRINQTAGSRVEERGGRLVIPVKLVGPKAVLEDEQILAGIRAYVRSDEAARKAREADPRLPVQFEGLPPGVTAEVLGGNPDTSEVSFE
jgi:hypothetical protein